MVLRDMIGTVWFQELQTCSEMLLQIMMDLSWICGVFRRARIRVNHHFQTVEPNNWSVDENNSNPGNSIHMDVGQNGRPRGPQMLV